MPKKPTKTKKTPTEKPSQNLDFEFEVYYARLTANPGQNFHYEFEVYNAFLNDIYKRFFEFEPEEIEKAPKYYIGNMEIGIQELENWITEEDRMPPNSPYQRATSEDIQNAPEADIVGIPDQTFKHRDRLVKKAQSQLKEIREIYQIPGHKTPKEDPQSDRSRGRWKETDKAKKIVELFTWKLIGDNPDIRTTEIVAKIQFEKIVIRPDQKRYSNKTIRKWVKEFLPDHNKRPGRPKKDKEK